MNIYQDLGKSASPEEVQAAFNGLTSTELLRLRKAARTCLLGTGYSDPWDLIGEAYKRTLEAALGLQGRSWKKAKGVEFMAHMTMTIRGLANDSLESFQSRKFKSIEAMATATMDAGDVLDRLGQTEDVVGQAVEAEAMDELLALAAKIEAHFAGDDEVTYIIEGRKDGYTAAQIREVGEMDLKRYENAQKRLQRGIAKLLASKEKL